MNIEILHKSKVNNPTDFDKGDVLEVIGNKLDSRWLVVGEDNLFLHTFWIQTGDYLGINKDLNTDNLKQFRVVLNIEHSTQYDLNA